MSATTFLLILAGVIVVLIGFMIKSWSELSRVTPKKGKERGDKDERDVED